MKSNWRDREYVKRAVQTNGMALQHAYVDLQKDKEIVKLAMQQNGEALRHASADLKKDKEVVKLAVQQNGEAIRHAHADLKKDKEIVRLAVLQNAEALQCVDLKRDKEIVMLAVQQNGEGLRHAHPDLRIDKEVVMTAVQQSGEAFRYAHSDLRKDKEFVKRVLQKNGDALGYVHLDLQKDKKIVKIAVQQNGLSLYYASSDLQQDKEIVKLAIQQNCQALEYAHPDLLKDKEIVKLAVQKNCEVLQYADDSLKNSVIFLCDLFFDQESLPSIVRNFLGTSVANEVDSFLKTNYSSLQMKKLADACNNKKDSESLSAQELQKPQVQSPQSESVTISKGLSETQIQLLQSENVTLLQNLSKANAQIQCLQDEIVQLKSLKGIIPILVKEVQTMSKDYKFDTSKFTQSLSNCQKGFQVLTELSNDVGIRVSKFVADALVLSSDIDVNNISKERVQQSKTEILALCEKRDKLRAELTTKLDGILTSIKDEDDLLCKFQLAKVLDNSLTPELLTSYSELRKLFYELQTDVTSRLLNIPKLTNKAKLEEEIKKIRQRKDEIFEGKLDLEELDLKIKRERWRGNIDSIELTKKIAELTSGMKKLQNIEALLSQEEKSLEALGEFKDFPELRLKQMEVSQGEAFKITSSLKENWKVLSDRSIRN